PLTDANGQPVATRALTAREHLEISQINVLLQNCPLVVLDLSSELMTEALSEGYRPSPALVESGMTIIALLPPGKDVAWAEQLLGARFTQSLSFASVSVRCL